MEIVRETGRVIRGCGDWRSCRAFVFLEGRRIFGTGNGSGLKSLLGISGLVYESAGEICGNRRWKIV